MTIDYHICIYDNLLISRHACAYYLTTKFRVTFVCIYIVYILGRHHLQSSWKIGLLEI